MDGDDLVYQKLKMRLKSDGLDSYELAMPFWAKPRPVKDFLFS